tara:strand:+ start:179 stop:406 length:228 start_codon:yes stop_codon:yes gene_type:complete
MVVNMKFVLVLWVCSFLNGQQCLEPVEYPVLFDSWYACSRRAHQESLAIVSKMGPAYVNQHKIALKYYCKETMTH